MVALTPIVLAKISPELPSPVATAVGSPAVGARALPIRADDRVLDVVVGDRAADPRRAERDTEAARDRDDLGRVGSVHSEVVVRTVTCCV